jgi:hypothetical protein
VKGPSGTKTEGVKGKPWRHEDREGECGNRLVERSGIGSSFRAPVTM